MERASGGDAIACPDCRMALSGVPSGTAVARRCARCRGIWLDPPSFQRLCEEESRPGEDAEGIAAFRGAATPCGGARREDRVRYRPCPQCGEVMNRRNFGKVSGVVIDVCRPHGAWFDRGELGAIRRFLREGGLPRYGRRLRLEEERRAGPTASVPVPRGGSLDDLYDVLVGDAGGWDVPSRVPRLALAILFAAFGAWAIWDIFDRPHIGRGWGAGGAIAGVAALYLAWRAFGEWWGRRGR